MEKKYKVTDHIIHGGLVRVHDPCLTEEAQDARQKRFEKACLIFMDKVFQQQELQKEKELAATSSSKKNKKIMNECL